MQIFLDETGQLSKYNDGQYFIVGSFTTGDSKRTSKQFMVWRHTKFPKNVRNLSEVKFSNSGLDENLKFKTIKFISSLDVRIHYSYLLKKDIPSDYRLRKGTIKTGHLYTDMVSKTLEMYLPNSDNDFRVFCDTRNLKGIKNAEFKSIVASNIKSQLNPKSIIQIERLDSTTNVNIQIADWICGALGRYHNNLKDGNNYYGLLKNNLIGKGLGIFKDYWSKNQKTQSKN